MRLYIFMTSSDNLAKQMAYNVLSMRRSSPPYKANRRFAVGWNVSERKPHKAIGDCGFSNPKGTNSVIANI